MLNSYLNRYFSQTIVDRILEKKNVINKEDIITLLSTKNPSKKNKIFNEACRIKEKYVSNKIYLRGLIEFSNICQKNCLYCGIRSGNKSIYRYELSDKEIIKLAIIAWQNKYGSIIIQSGERSDKYFIYRIDRLLKEIKKNTNYEIGITLCCGEQTEETYRRWFESGAHRYLLRIETSNKNLYNKIHPNDEVHSYNRRIKALSNIKKTGYQTGTGVMIGLPFQTLNDLANDLLFIKEFDIDMVGMGPYIEHKNTPLFKYKRLLMSNEERFNLTLLMIAILRIIMKDINIAATTALQTINIIGREKGIKAGANVIMPNITPTKYRNRYLLYDNKPYLDENNSKYKNYLYTQIETNGNGIAYGEWGDPKHYFNRIELQL